MKIVNNMQLLAGSSDNKKTTGSFSLKFNAPKVKLEMLIEDPACTKIKFKEKKKKKKGDAKSNR